MLVLFDLILLNYFISFSSCIDTTQQGDLDQCKTLTNYIDSNEFGTFSLIG